MVPRREGRVIKVPLPVFNLRLVRALIVSVWTVGVCEFTTGQSRTLCWLDFVGPFDFIVGSADLHFESSCTITVKCSRT